MPMWIIHAPEGAYSTEDKKNITEIITQFYVDTVALPRFYVVVRFDEYPVGLDVGRRSAGEEFRAHRCRSRRTSDGRSRIRELCMSMMCRDARSLHQGPWNAHGNPPRRDGKGPVVGRWHQAASAGIRKPKEVGP